MKLTIGPVRFIVRSEMVPTRPFENDKSSSTQLIETGLVLWMSLETSGGRIHGIRVPVNVFKKGWLGRIRSYSIQR